MGIVSYRNIDRTGWRSISPKSSGQMLYWRILKASNARNRMTLKIRKTVEISLSPEN